MAPYEALYVRQCRSMVGWFKSDESRSLGAYFVCDALEKKSYIGKKVHDVAFMESERVLLRVSPMKYVIEIWEEGQLEFSYLEDQSHLLAFSSVQLDENLAYEEPVTILDRQVQKLRSKEIASLKV
ncbi:uncharacterized protein LOC142163579 [Nicotiana tabacum]|uniref:Uncharacterized protein LOC142163579 n=1 Tax=Nicotiana tabacum TaxID=4097 RepID=A0AC58RW73_TOBAC